ncbi:GNAT family N-acetyltransferase [Streptomyces sp. WMMC897]|uniref:GNAT family N-acetyltransferase n=1 Tax=Streptomyces sp. WMMC897 TaxID=3014782 RepID=UPI0022B69E91|nr:GNAT family N-acetyltransferase [Streptomyces sp. WMMC897]MCZ7414515.1 GNAT family N-acetyltransferase [Streptomyces sp. WMMC897]
MDVEIVNATGQHRFEAHLGDRVAAVVAYRDTGRVRELIHTQVDAEFEGQGVASALARGALDELRAEGLLVRPTCPYVTGWIKRHAEYLDMVEPQAKPLVTSA